MGQTRLLVDQLWGRIFVLAPIGFVANLFRAATEARVLRWHSSQNTRRRSSRQNRQRALKIRVIAEMKWPAPKLHDDNGELIWVPMN